MQKLHIWVVGAQAQGAFTDHYQAWIVSRAGPTAARTPAITKLFRDLLTRNLGPLCQPFPGRRTKNQQNYLTILEKSKSLRIIRQVPVSHLPPSRSSQEQPTPSWASVFLTGVHPYGLSVAIIFQIYSWEPLACCPRPPPITLLILNGHSLVSDSGNFFIHFPTK